jgi:hypothetical protein
MRAISVLRHGWLRPASTARTPSLHARVTWIGPEPAPGDEEWQAVYAAIIKEGLRTYGQIAAAVADDLFARDFAQCGWLADIGLFRAWYLSGAYRLLARLDGTAVRILPADVVDSARA